MNSLQALHAAGQSIWLDYIRRHLLVSGDLRRLIEQDALTGMTSNPTLFEKAIAGSGDYDETLRSLLAGNRDMPVVELYERLVIEDIRMAADALRGVWDKDGGQDGFVSLEVPAGLARDAAATIVEGRRLFQLVDRPNLMIKVPATRESLAAIEALTADGVNVNITLIFSVPQYEAVAQAYLRGIARCPDPARVHSVASFFVSRVDTKVDRALDGLATDRARALRGTIAVANAKVAYQQFKTLFLGAGFRALAEKGAHVQRPLWASTGTKDPKYSDVKYVEELIGPNTVNTMPPATLDAFRDHGVVRPTLEQGLADAERQIAELESVGIDLDQVAEELQREGLEAFDRSFQQLLQSLDTKRHAMTAPPVDRQVFALGGLQARVTARIDAWTRDHVAGRFWQKDPTLWGDRDTPELANRLGWLTSHDGVREHLDEMRALADEARAEAVQNVVLLGMGGSSLAPEVFERTFPIAAGYPALTVLDSTHPESVGDVRQHIDPGSTWFLVSSKSGTTLESLSFFRYFWAQVSEVSPTAGRHFLAITDPGTPLESLARARGFRRVFAGLPEVGGRYSALTAFGLVPAALSGIDIERLLDRSWVMAEACSFCVPEASNPALALGAALGELALAGRDKVTFFTSPRLAAFPAWLEQLIAESTGKQGKGIVPVADEPLGEPGTYGDDRVFVLIDINEHPYAAGQTIVERLQAQGHPVIRMQLSDSYDLGQEMFRWEFAVAAAGNVLAIQPFDQPDVQLAKDLARQAMSGTGDRNAQADDLAIAADPQDRLQSAVREWMSKVRAHDYIGIQAYLAPTERTTSALEQLRVLLRDRLRVATTLGFGPRFLHSTGQLHKGGPDSGIFLQIVDRPASDLPVPETDYTFGQLIAAQALGDYRALLQRGRRALRVQVGTDAGAGIRSIATAVEQALGATHR